MSISQYVWRSSSPAVAHLKTVGFHETEDENNPRRMIVKRTGPAGFPQVYVMDPDGNVIEINAAR